MQPHGANRRSPSNHPSDEVARSHEAKFWLLPVELAANYGFKWAELTRIEELVEAHANEFMEAWNEHFS